MTIETMPFRDFQRGMIPSDRIVELQDMKSKKSKGLFVPVVLQNMVLELLAKKEAQLTDKRLSDLESIVGIADGLTADQDTKTLKTKRVEAKYGN